MSALLPCPFCARHVRATSSACPFCHCALTPVDVPVATTGGARVSRAVAFAFGAALSLEGCIESATPVYGAPAPPPDAALNDAGDAAVDAIADGAPADDGSPGVRYGAPPAEVWC